MLRVTALLYEVLVFIKTLASRIEYLKANKERAELDKNAGLWFRNHFSGMPTDKQKSKADKTNP